MEDEQLEIKFTPEEEPYDFIASVKLTTGDELIAGVTYPPEDQSVIMLHNPMQVLEANASEHSTVIKGFKLDLWMKSCMSQDETFILDRANIITLQTVNPPIREFYKENIDMVFKNSIPNRVRPTPHMGNLGSINKARAAFERIYKT